MSDNLRKYNTRKQRNRFDLKSKANGKLRISVYRSNKFIYAQVIDDAAGNTIASVSSKTAKTKKAAAISKDIAKNIGLDLGKKLVNLGQVNVYYDRGGYRYHGVVKALADGVREAGIKF